MSKRLLLLVVGIWFGIPAGLMAEEMNRPNILWIFVEDLSPFMGCYGDEINRGATPSIDRMAKEGVLFTRAFMPAPVCSACRSAMITGVMQTTTGTHHHRSSRHTDGQVVPESLRIHLPSGVRTIPELFREAGYFTFNSGKDDYNFHYDRRALFSVGTPASYRAGQNGWQGNSAEHVGSLTEGTWRDRPDPSQPWFGQILLWGGKANAKHVRDGSILASDAIQPPPYFPDTPAQRAAWVNHYNAVRGTDAQVEAIFDQLREDGELEKTIIFFFSDHGSPDSLRHKQFCYEGGVHVPAIIWGQHPHIATGTRRHDLIHGLDLSATTLALAGIQIPGYFHGKYLFALDHQPRPFVVSARDRCDYSIDRIRTVRTDRFRYIRNYYPKRPLLQAQYRDNTPYTREMRKMHEQGELPPWLDTLWFGERTVEELYEIASDPHQLRNLALEDAYSHDLAFHRQLLENWIRETGDCGEQAEPLPQLKATFDLWKNNPIFKNAETNPEYDPFRKK